MRLVVAAVVAGVAALPACSRPQSDAAAAIDGDDGSDELTADQVENYLESLDDDVLAPNAELASAGDDGAQVVDWNGQPQAKDSFARRHHFRDVAEYDKVAAQIQAATGTGTRKTLGNAARTKRITAKNQAMVAKYEKRIQAAEAKRKVATPATHVQIEDSGPPRK